MRTFAPVSLAAFFLLCSSGCGNPNTGVVDDARLRNAEGDSANWLMYGRTYDEHRFSPLRQINEQSIRGLGLAWSLELETTRGLEATPLVLDGVIYLTSSWSVVHAIDARTSEMLWTFDPQVDRARAADIVCCDMVNRGVALYDGKVYVGTLDGRLIALDAVTGGPVWDVLTIDPNRPYAITGYPRVANGLVMIATPGRSSASAVTSRPTMRRQARWSGAPIPYPTTRRSASSPTPWSARPKRGVANGDG